MKLYHVAFLHRVANGWNRPEWVEKVSISYDLGEPIRSVTIVLRGCCAALPMRVEGMPSFGFTGEPADLKGRLLADLDRAADALKAGLEKLHAGKEKQQQPDDDKTLAEHAAAFALERGVELAPLPVVE